MPCIFHSQQMSDLHGRGTHTSRNRMDENTMRSASSGGSCHPGLPISEVSGEIIDRKGSRLLIAPEVRNRPQHVQGRCDFFRKGARLGRQTSDPASGLPIPENSRPAISGAGGVPGYPPLVVITSAKFSPPTRTRTTDWPVLGVGSGASSTWRASGPESCIITSAFMMKSVAGRPSQMIRSQGGRPFTAGIYCLRLDTNHPATPLQAGTGRILFPLILTRPHIHFARPVLAGAARKRRGASCREFGNAACCIRGEVAVDIVLVRFLFVIVVAITCFLIQPFGRTAPVDAGIGALIGPLCPV